MAVSSSLDTLADLALDDAHDVDDTTNRTTMRRYIADGAIELAEEHNWEHLKNTWSFPTTAAESYYKMSNMDWVYSMTKTDGTPVPRIDKEDMDRLDSSAAELPLQFAHWGWADGLIIKLAPQPTGVQTLIVNGITMQPRISGTGDIPVTESRFQELLILGGVWRWKTFKQANSDEGTKLYALWKSRVEGKKKRDPGAKGSLVMHLSDDLLLARRDRMLGNL